MTPTLEKLKSLSDAELIAEYDKKAQSTVTGTQFFLEEIRYREQSKIAIEMHKITRQIWWFTVIVLIANVVSAILTAVQFFR